MRINRNLNLTNQELANVLASLRVLQDTIEQGELENYRKLPHFDDNKPLSSEEIDGLCERLNTSGDIEHGKYLEGNGNHCLHCSSDSIEGGYVNIDDCGASQEVSCKSCGSTWTDAYALIGVVNVEIGN